MWGDRRTPASWGHGDIGVRSLPCPLPSSLSPPGAGLSAPSDRFKTSGASQPHRGERTQGADIPSSLTSLHEVPIRTDGAGQLTGQRRPRLGRTASPGASPALVPPVTGRLRAWVAMWDPGGGYCVAFMFRSPPNATLSTHWRTSHPNVARKALVLQKLCPLLNKGPLFPHPPQSQALVSVPLTQASEKSVTRGTPSSLLPTASPPPASVPTSVLIKGARGPSESSWSPGDVHRLALG